MISVSENMPISKAEIVKQESTNDTDNQLEIIDETAQSNDNGDETNHIEVNFSKLFHISLY